MLTGKDFRAIAEIIRKTYVDRPSDEHKEFERGINVGCQDIANRLVCFLANQNPRFDRDKFLNACFDL